MCSETDFAQEKYNFHPTTGIPSSSKIQISMKKGTQNFTFAYGQGQGGLTPPPPYGQPDRKISVFYAPHIKVITSFSN